MYATKKLKNLTTKDFSQQKKQGVLYTFSLVLGENGENCIYRFFNIYGIISQGR